MHRILLILLLSTPVCSCAYGQEGETLAWGDLPEALLEARRVDRAVLVYVHAPWCGPCRRMEREVFPAVRPLLARFVRAKLNYGDHDTRLALRGQVLSPFDWAHQLGAEATPTFVFLSPGGQSILRVTSYLDAEVFARLLAYVATDAYRHVSFETYAARVKPPRR